MNANEQTGGGFAAPARGNARGIRVRAALLAAARACAARDAPLPAYRVLAALIGISSGQVSRHMGRLMDAGAFTIRRRHRRIYVAAFAADAPVASASAKNPTEPIWPGTPLRACRCPTPGRSL
jgi:hypothetical protein